jgi:site-specific DNA-methyltransferase (adenine-specific)
MIKAEFSGGVVYNADFRDVLPTLAPVNLCIADVPYGVAYKTHMRKRTPTPDMLANDDKPRYEFIPPLVRAVKPDSAIYLCTRFDVYAGWEQALKDAGATIKTTIVWDKGNHTAGDLTGSYGNQVELLLFAHVGFPKLRQGRPSNLWRIPRDVASSHPTPKPVELFRRCILNSSDHGDTVLDPFLGSGTSAVAAILTGRRFVGIELNKQYFDLSCERIEKVYREIGSRLPGFEPLALEQQGVLFE